MSMKKQAWDVDHQTIEAIAAHLIEALEIVAHNLTSLISAYPDKYPRHAFQGTADIARAAIAKARRNGVTGKATDGK